MCHVCNKYWFNEAEWRDESCPPQSVTNAYQSAVTVHQYLSPFLDLNLLQ